MKPLDIDRGHIYDMYIKTDHLMTKWRPKRKGKYLINRPNKIYLCLSILFPSICLALVSNSALNSVCYRDIAFSRDIKHAQS